MAESFCTLWYAWWTSASKSFTKLLLNETAIRVTPIRLRQIAIDVWGECPGRGLRFAPQTDPFGVGSSNQEHSYYLLSIGFRMTYDKKDPAAAEKPQGQLARLKKAGKVGREKLIQMSGRDRPFRRHAQIADRLYFDKPDCSDTQG